MSLGAIRRIIFGLFTPLLNKREPYMARVTVEDCLGAVDNRFELVLVAAKRARQLARGISEPTLPWDNDKPTVMALREIAEGHVTRDILKQKDDSLQPSSLDLALTSSALNLDGFTF